METIYELQRRATILRTKTQVDSISPEEVGGLHVDTLEYIAYMEQSSDGLGIRRVYKTKELMEADAAPIGTNGKPLRFGQLVCLFDADNRDSVENGNIYSWQNPGWLLVGNIESVYEFKTGLSYEMAARTNGDEELLKRIQGRSENSQSLYDPFKVLPESMDEYGGFETIAGILRSLNTLVPGQHGEYADMLCGYYRGNLQGVPLQVYNFPLHYATEEVVQYLIGPFVLDDNGNIVVSMIHYFILRRRHSANKGWEPWVQLKMLTVDEINDINDKISCLQKDINKIDKKIESSDTVVAALTKAEINDLCDYGECKALTEEELERALNEEFNIEDYKNCGCSPAALSEVLDVLGTERPDCECDGITEEEINDI